MGNSDLLTLNSLTKVYGDFLAVDNVSLTIKKHERFCLLGESGCGKTTLLRLISGFEEPTSGTIELDGEIINSYPPHQRATNLMFQSYALFPHMTVEDNVAYGLRRQRLPKNEVIERVAEILAMVKMSDFRKRMPEQLSGGQQQRIALARSIVKRPKLLLLDEPLSSLDKKLRNETQYEIMHLQEKFGITLIVVTHDQEEAMVLGNKIGIMKSGKLVQTGEPLTVYEYPTSRFIAKFIGTINSFEGKIIENRFDSLLVSCVKEAGLSFEISKGENNVKGNITNQTIWVSIRPEKIMISLSPFDSKEQRDSANSCKGVITRLIYKGSHTYYRVTCGELIFSVLSQNEKRGVDAFNKGDWVFLRWGRQSIMTHDK